MDEEVDPDYEPNQKEIQDYANWLGMDVDEDSELMWIAREGLKVSRCHRPGNPGGNGRRGRSRRAPDGPLAGAMCYPPLALRCACLRHAC